MFKYLACVSDTFADHLATVVLKYLDLQRCVKEEEISPGEFISATHPSPHIELAIYSLEEPNGAVFIADQLGKDLLNPLKSLVRLITTTPES